MVFFFFWMEGTIMPHWPGRRQVAPDRCRARCADRMGDDGTGAAEQLWRAQTGGGRPRWGAVGQARSWRHGFDAQVAGVHPPVSRRAEGCCKACVP
ncbi:MAG: hypothetical protein BJ554DRAFT_5392 [Olpidium bornovanus]|uniref:Uncharacterized protein n=1 Tax=Olpidium bornovanus TaxID=278681 RepID=A0A8H7ZZP4_9FUNG|nr:MAG: hypothetical protein BJ554DRAFT_5392 [Olpidium bornovanus]